MQPLPPTTTPFKNEHFMEIKVWSIGHHRPHQAGNFLNMFSKAPSTALTSFVQQSHFPPLLFCWKVSSCLCAVTASTSCPAVPLQIWVSHQSRSTKVLLASTGADLLSWQFTWLVFRCRPARGRGSFFIQPPSDLQV